MRETIFPTRVNVTMLNRFVESEMRELATTFVREKSGPTGFPPIVPGAANDTVCRNAHGFVCHPKPPPWPRDSKDSLLSKELPLIFYDLIHCNFNICSD